MKKLLNLATLPFRKRPAVGGTPADEIHAENKWRLLRYRRDTPATFDTPVLLVPSLINRHYILDLVPGKSLVEFLLARGHDVFVIDWGTPGPEDRFLTFDDICDRYLGRALRITARHSPRGNAHVLGYCLGGTLAAIHAAVHPKRFASLIALAAPVAFGDRGLLSRWTRTNSFDVDTVVEATGLVPWQLLQSAFHMLRPTLGLSKAVHLLDRAESDEFLDGFVAMETWGNDNVSFPGECYRRYVRELYREDALVKGTFRLSGKRADLSRIDCPVLAITFEHDGIVPAESAAALLDHVSSSDAHRLHLPGGHVGAVVARSAAKGLWPAISDFWSARDGSAKTPARVTGSATLQ